VARVLNDEETPSPLAQRGRPHAWCSSTIHTVLHRELFAA
jgi:hypothetical protein